MLRGFETKKAFVIGEHLGHTFSPQIHSELADYSYLVKELQKEELEHFFTKGDFDFLNVTIPYKKQIIPFLSRLSPEAEAIGAVNTVKRTADGSLEGHNTDYYGFLYLLKKSKISVCDAKVLVLGSGGASLPVKQVLRDCGAKEIITVSRTGENNYQNISKHNDAHVIVNTTPVGMYPNNLISPIELEGFPKCRGVIDIIYNPSRTKLLLDAEKLGIANIGGLPMLVAQAKRAAEIFTEKTIDDSETDRITDIILRQTQNIILVGMPGCGKSTVGKIIAKKLGRAFFDSDEVFEERYQTTPKEVIEAYGESEFRSMEHKIIIELGKNSSSVIATGGGIVTVEDNYAPLHQNGSIFFIERELNKLPIANRPISKSVGVEELYRIRLPLYTRFCDHRIVSDEIKENTANKIIEFFNSDK